MRLSDDQLAKLTLARTKGIGPVAYSQLIGKHGSAQKALTILPTLKRKVPFKPPSEKDIFQEIQNVEAMGGSFLFWREEGYPTLLSQIADPPPVLTILGNPNHLQKPQLAIVGNRNASANGVTLTKSLAHSLVESGFAITSGLARGIDTSAHQATLAVGGSTIAVLGCGADVVYPPENKELYEQIKAEGCIVSENAWGTKPSAQLFPRRNRIISGLSYATIVTEASRHSGSLITAQYAGEQGRDVFAVPGSPADPRAAGPNHLLKQGAELLETVEDILNIIKRENLPAPKPSTSYTREEQHSFLLEEQEETPEENIQPKEAPLPSSPREKLLSLLSSSPTPVDDLIRQSKLDEADAVITLTELDLEGLVIRHANGSVSTA